MTTPSDGTTDAPPSLSGQISASDVTMDLTMCGLHVDRAEELARLYAEHGSWNEVKEIWFQERRANRSTRDSSQKLFRVLTSRFTHAPATLPSPDSLPVIFDRCRTTREKAQTLYLYLVADDPLVRYVVHEYCRRIGSDHPGAFDFSNDTLGEILDDLSYSDGSAFDYADSTVERWCEGFRSVMREIGCLQDQQAVAGDPPSLGETPLLVATGYSYEAGADDWVTSPLGLQYLLQPAARWDELYDRVAETDWWEFLELHGSLRLRPTDRAYSWIQREEGA